MSITFNNRVKQILLLGLLILLLWAAVKELFLFLPGLLGAVTLYILSRATYFQLIFKKKWKKGSAAGLFVIYYLILLGLPVFLAATLISPKINEFLNDPTAMFNGIKTAVFQIQEKVGFEF